MFRKRLAGHEFIDDHIDSPCIYDKPNEVRCMMTRACLFQATEADIDKEGFAHTSYLSRSEYSDIAEERKIYDAHCEKVMEALRQVCG